ncbi:lysis protein [Serratia marcescens]|uniref:lysis protein n=1 Tax=Serratia marcescens TaxID=615 RepID=UPI003204A7F9
MLTWIIALFSRQRGYRLAFFLSVLLSTVIILLTFLWQREKSRVKTTEKHLAVMQAQLVSQQQRLQYAARLDEAHTRKLHDAEQNIATLRLRVESGAERLRVAATCPSMPTTATATRLDDAASPRLTRDAQQAYFSHRKNIARAEQMILGLQQYIREQCLR